MTYTATRPAGLTLSAVRPTGLTSPESTRIPAWQHHGVFTEQAAADDAAVPTTWLGAALAQLERFEELEPGWDGGRATPIQASVTDAVRSFIRSEVVERTANKPQLVPTLDGGVQLEWHTEEIDLILEVPPSGTPSYFLRDVESGVTTESPLADDTTPLAHALAKLGYE